MSSARPSEADGAGPVAPARGWPRLLGWVPVVVIGAGLALGLVLWGKWGFLIAFEAVRAYCL